MRNNKKRSLIALLTAVMLLSGTIGLTAAYFSDVDPHIGDAQLILKGKTEIDEGDKDTEKNITIRNVGEVPVYVRVKLFGPDQLKIDPLDESKWFLGDDGFYYYYKILQPGDETPENTLVGTVTLNERQAAEMGDSFTVTAVQECATIIYDDNNKAWPWPPLKWTLPEGVEQ